MARLEALSGPLPELPSDPSEVLALLDGIGSPATVAMSGGRYFGFVMGGSLPEEIVNAAGEVALLDGCFGTDNTARTINLTNCDRPRLAVTHQSGFRLMRAV